MDLRTENQKTGNLINFHSIDRRIKDGIGEK